MTLRYHKALPSCVLMATCPLYSPEWRARVSQNGDFSDSSIKSANAQKREKHRKFAKIETHVHPPLSAFLVSHNINWWALLRKKNLISKNSVMEGRYSKECSHFKEISESQNFRAGRKIFQAQGSFQIPDTVWGADQMLPHIKHLAMHPFYR